MSAENPDPKVYVYVVFSSLRIVYTEQMDAEGLGRKLLLTPSGGPRGAVL